MSQLLTKILPGTGRWQSPSTSLWINHAAGVGLTEGSGPHHWAQRLRRDPDPSAPAAHLPVPGRI